MTDLHFLPWFRTGFASSIDQQAVAGLAQQSQATTTVDIAIEAHPVSGDDPEVHPLEPKTVSLHGPGSIAAIDEGAILRRYPEPGATDPETNYFVHVEFSDPDFPWRYTPAAPDPQGRLQPWLALVVVDTDAVTVESNDQGLDRLIVDDAANQLPRADEVWAWAHVQVESDGELGDPATLWSTNPSAMRSRLLCPRRLDPDRSWMACIVPTFEAGRLAGLGSSGSSAEGLAWGNSPDVVLPIYTSWTFRTSESGDFESLVRRLEARELPASIGSRDMDVGDPGGGLPVAPDQRLSFQGALVSPSAAPLPWPTAHRTATLAALRAVLAPGAESLDDETPFDPLRHDPVVRPSLYGGPQASRVDLPAPNGHPRWLRELNTEPPNRAAAGIGAAVVRMDQEQLMDAAWDAAAGLRELNRRLNAAALAVRVGAQLQDRLSRLPSARLVQFVGPSMRRVRDRDGTLLSDLRRSDLPEAVASGAYRRIGRHGGLAARRLKVDDPATATVARITKDPTGPATSYTRRAVPAGCDVAGLDVGVDPKRDDPAMWLDPAVRGFIGPAVEGRPSLLKKPTKGPPARVGTINKGTVEAGETSAGEIIRHTIAPPRFFGPRPEAPAPKLTEAVHVGAAMALDAPRAVSALTRAHVTAPEHTWPESGMPERIWATPSFPAPLYERVRELSVEYLVPGVGEIPEDTLGLLKTNSTYLESLMVGANHELSREFLWREYPAQLHRTWFQQFWNAPEPDIAPIASWHGAEPLGGQGAAATPDLVLLIKGAFPRRYPDVVVYAQQAHRPGAQSQIRDVDPAGERRYPILAGELGPGVVFYGFALGEKAANGATLPGGEPGWFFVLEERPTGIRFGLDNGSFADAGTAPSTWADLTWGHVTNAAAAGERLATHIDISATPWLNGRRTGNDSEVDAWGAGSAAMAAITLQPPVQLKAHASSMLLGAKN